MVVTNHQCPIFNGGIAICNCVKVIARISNYIPQSYKDVIIYPHDDPDVALDIAFDKKPLVYSRLC